MSALVLVALLLQVVSVAEPKPIRKEIAKTADLYASSRAYTDCLGALKVEIAARMEYLKNPDPFVRLEMERVIASRDSICGQAIVLHLTEGLAVDVSENLGPCSVPDSQKEPKMERVRLVTGKDAGAVGCVVASVLREPVPF